MQGNHTGGDANAGQNPPGVARQELLKQYDLEQRYYDEMFSAPGQARPHCQQSAGSHIDDGDWPLLLRACNAFAAYGHKFGGALDRGNIVDLLVAEADLPYSLRYVLRRLRACLAVVGPAPDEDLPAQPFVVLKQLDDLLGSRPAASPTSQSRELHELAQLGRLLREFHDALEQSYVYYPADA